MPQAHEGQRAVIRPPAVAGTFYPASPTSLRDLIDACYAHPLGPGKAPNGDAPVPLAIVGPHAGVVYSGPFAAHAYSAIGRPAVAVILGPCHSGSAAGLALSTASAWRTPLGDVALDAEMTDLLRDACPSLAPDDRAHGREHSIELQVIFLQHAVGPEIRIVPIALSTGHLGTLELLARGLLEAARRGALIVASTDLSHYLPEPLTRTRDRALLRRVEALDVDGLTAVLARNEGAACGAAGVIATLLAARAAGCAEARFLAYGTSGDIGGPRDAVVGYGALRIDRPAAS